MSQQSSGSEDQKKRKQQERDRSKTVELPVPRRTEELPAVKPTSLVTVERPSPIGPAPAKPAKRKKS